MKQNLLRFVTPLVFVFSIVFSLQAQTIQVVPNPDAPDIFAYSGGPLSGYTGNPIILNGSLSLQYQPASSNFSSDSNYILQQAAYSGSIHQTANPDGGKGSYFNAPQVVFNNKVFYIYLNAQGTQQLASFDGTLVTLYPNPDGGLGYIGSPRIFNNSLYVAYSNAAGATQLGKFTGTGITLIPNPDNSTIGYYYNYSFVFAGKLCSRYVTASGVRQLAVFDGTSWALLPNPDNTANGLVKAFPVLYHNKLYFKYFSATNQFQLLQYDGVNNPTLIPNPVDASSNNGGYAGFPIVYNDTLFIQYYNTANALQVAKFGGTSISLVPNPDNSSYGFYNTPIVYNNNLYIFYVTPDGIHHLTLYQTASNSLKIFPNPDAGLGYWDQPIVYDNNLFFQYYNAGKTFQLGYFNGTSLRLINNPGGYYNGSSGNNGYLGYPIIFNNLLYMQFGGIVTGNVGSLCYLDGSTLPVSLLSFTAQAQGKSTLVKWQTANETNNAYFEVERSADGVSFTAIGKINGYGSSAIEQQYNFTDNSPLDGVDYYRLKQVDLDGIATYSSVAKVSFGNLATALHVYPNPAKNTVVITLPASASGSVVNVFDMSGRKLMQKQISANTSSQTLDVSSLASGKYELQWLPKNGKPQTVPLVKQ